MMLEAVAAVSLAFLAGESVASPVQVGEVIVQRIETEHPYRVAVGDVSGRVLERTLNHEGATYIAIHFERFELAAGDYLIVRSPDREQSWRYEGLGRGNLGQSPGGFWATHIRGDAAVVELHARVGGAWGFTIDRFARGYTRSELPGDVEATCGTDDAEWAPCYQTSEPWIYQRARAVARLLITGNSSCTGWLVGCEGHLLTRRTCIPDQFSAANTDYEFMAEGESCTTDCSDDFACPGTIEATGATLVKASSSYNYSLLELPVNLSSEYGYLTLRNGNAIVNERIYVPSHRQSWGKRIAVHSTHVQDQSGFCEVQTLGASCGGSPALTHFCDGDQVGSAGAPILAYADHRVISMYTCGTCPNSGPKTPDVIDDLGPDLPACATASPAGSITLDSAGYTCSETVTITVRDSSLDGETSQIVTIESPAEPGGERQALAAASPGAETFVGTIELSVTAAVGGDGKLSIADGQTITVRYIDEDDGQGGVNLLRTATAQIDCSAPVISDVHVTVP